jgi:hypothetical protein
MSYPEFRGFELGICQRSAGAEFMLKPRTSFVPMVNMHSDSFSCSVRRYFPKQNKEDIEAFVSVRLSSRKNASFGVGMRDKWFSPCFGLSYNCVTDDVKPFISIGWTFGFD